jgi:arylsulfatase A-like enzyme
MDSPSFIGCLSASVAVSLLAGCVALREPAPDESALSKPPARRPNIILIMADDIGIEGFGCYGGTSYGTPVIDALAREGVRFTQCHSQPLCTPSRMKIMTGRSNIYNYRHFGIMDPDEPTFGPMMRQAGYATAVAGKWQLYGAENYGELAGTGMHAREAGFDEYCLWQIDRLGSRYWDPHIERNGRVLEDVAGKYGPDIFCDFICDYIERHKDGPFFVYYPMALVHNPFVPTPDSADRESKRRQRNFADMVAYMDGLVGRIVAQLDELGLRENTMILFTADNGTNRNITSMMGETAVRGGKGRTTDAGTHVPLVLNWPAGAATGAICEDLVDFSDFVPTIAQAAGIDPASAGLRPDGRSFLPQIRGEPGAPREWIFCYYNPRPGRKGFPERRFARDERWKLYGDGRLFDLHADPREEDPIDPQAEEGTAAEARRRLQAAIDSFPQRPQKINAVQ